MSKWIVEFMNQMSPSHSYPFSQTVMTYNTDIYYTEIHYLSNLVFIKDSCNYSFF